MDAADGMCYLVALQNGTIAGRTGAKVKLTAFRRQHSACQGSCLLKELACLVEDICQFGCQGVQRL